MQRKKPDFSKQKFGRSSLNATKKKCRKNVTAMRVPIFSGGENKGDPEAAISIILFCSSTISLFKDTAAAMLW